MVWCGFGGLCGGFLCGVGWVFLGSTFFERACQSRKVALPLEGSGVGGANPNGVPERGIEG